MTRFARPRLLTVSLAVAFALGLAACGDDASPTPAETAAPTDSSSTERSDVTASTAPGDDPAVGGDASALVVPLDYLQGEWCNSDGEAWSFEGETARFGESHDELIGELPVGAALAAGPGREVVSQSDNEFVVDWDTREVTFTRGRC